MLNDYFYLVQQVLKPGTHMP